MSVSMADFLSVSDEQTFEQIFHDYRDVIFSGMDLGDALDTSPTFDFEVMSERHASESDDSHYHSDIEDICSSDNSDRGCFLQTAILPDQNYEQFDPSSIDFRHTTLDTHEQHKEDRINQIKANLPGYPLEGAKSVTGAVYRENTDYHDIPSPVLNEWPGQAPTRRKRVRRCYKLWQFILDLLKDEHKTDLVRWVDRKSGIFTFVQSQEVATEWGRKKNKPTMTYEHLARAIRHYYKQQVMRRIPGRRLVYQFGPSAQGWQE